VRPIVCLLSACGLIAIAPSTAWATPSAQDVSVNTTPGIPVQISLQGSSNLDSPIGFSIIGVPAQGPLGPIGSPSCTFNPGVTNCSATVTYTPGTNASGIDGFTYGVSDSDGTAVATASIAVVPVPPPGYTDSAFTTADPGVTATLGLPGINAALTNPGPATALVVLATYPPNGANAVYDVRTVSPTDSAQLKVTFSYSGDAPPVLLYQDRLTGQLRPVQSSTYVVDPIAHTITVVFDQSSTPTLRGLNGTRFEAGPLPRIEQLEVRPGCAASGERASLRLSLSQAATVDVSVARRKGSSGRASCARHRSRNHAPAHFERARRLNRALPAGQSKIRLPGLAPGAYRVEATATSTNGSASETRTLTVTG
jgi:hypothetical protein